MTQTSSPPRGRPGAAAGLLVALAALTFACTTPPKARAHARPDALQLLEVDDDDDLFDPAPGALPAGVSLQVENAPVGPGATAPRHFARLVPGPGESKEAARTRLVTWAETLATPKHLHVIAGPVSEYDDDKGKLEGVGFRTFLVRGTPIVDGASVAGAQAGPDNAPMEGWHVLVELDPAGGERLRAFTAQHVKRRLAIVVDGVVESAPVIQAEIPGGRVTITMGSGAPDQQQAEAKSLASKLLGP